MLLAYFGRMPMTGRERDALRRGVRITDPTVCFHCKRKDLDPKEKYCPDCGFPQGGTEQERWNFVIAKRKERSAREDQKGMIGKARMYLWIAAGLNMIPFIVPDQPVIIVVGVIISSIFGGLAIWAGKKPYPALLTGLITYVTIQLFLAILDWRLLFGGLIWKIAIIGALFYALRSAKALEAAAAADGRTGA